VLASATAVAGTLGGVGAALSGPLPGSAVGASAAGAGAVDAGTTDTGTVDGSAVAACDVAARGARAGAGIRAVTLRVALGAAGFGLVAALVAHAGPARLLEVLGRAAPWLPLALAAEGTRILAETLASAALWHATGAQPGWGRLLRAHLVAYPVVLLAPAGRTAGEVVKAAILGTSGDAPRAAAIATHMQALVLFATGLVSVPCALAAAAVDAPALASALAAQALGLGAAGLAITLAVRRPELGRLLARFRRTAALGEAYRAASLRLGLVSGAGLGWMLVARGAQLAALTTLLAAASPAVAPLAGWTGFGATLVGGSAGDFVPGQLGATDAALAAVHDTLGLSVPDAVAVGLLAHAVQLAWVLVGVVAGLVRSNGVTGPSQRVTLPREDVAAAPRA
jgi:hypothetical protein